MNGEIIIKVSQEEHEEGVGTRTEINFNMHHMSGLDKYVLLNAFERALNLSKEDMMLYVLAIRDICQSGTSQEQRIDLAKIKEMLGKKDGDIDA